MSSDIFSNNFYNFISTCQQKYREASTIEIKDHYYLIATGVSTVAFAAFQLYAPITCVLSTIALSTLNAHQFVKAISEAGIDESGLLKKWMMVSCLVTSSVLGVYAIQSLPLFVTGMEALLTLEAPFAVFCFTIVTGALGFGLTTAKSIYERGLELFKTPKWEDLENYLASKFKEKMHPHERLVLFLLIMMPELVPLGMFSRYEFSGFYFVAEDQQDYLFEALLKHSESWGNPFELVRRLELFFLSLSESLKTKYYPHLVNLDSQNNLLTQDFKAKIPGNCIQSYKTKLQDTKAKYNTLLDGIKSQLSEMTEKIEKIVEPKIGKPLSEKDSTTLNTLKGQLTSLRDQLKNFMSDCKLYCPKLSLSQYNDLQIELLGGKFQKALTRLISLQASVNEAGAQRLDLDETIGNYILMNYTNGDPLGGVKLFAEVAKKFNLGPQDLDELEKELKPLGIETVGKFIDVIFSGQKEGLNNSKLLLEKLDAYLDAKKESENQSEKDFRARMYTALSGIKALSSHSSQIINIASKVTYRAVMILSTVAPIIFQPEVFAITFAGTVVCNLTYASMGHLIPQDVKYYTNSIKKVPEINAIIQAVRLASRRPFLNLFSRLDYIDYETQTFLGADFFAKMRLLSIELFYGTLVSYLSIGHFNEISIGGFIAGAAVGNEATELIQKAWKKINLKI